MENIKGEKRFRGMAARQGGPEQDPRNGGVSSGGRVEKNVVQDSSDRSSHRQATFHAYHYMGNTHELFFSLEVPGCQR